MDKTLANLKLWLELSQGTLSNTFIGARPEIKEVEGMIKEIEEYKESDAWMESATDYYESGGCPICFETDEAGHKGGCYIKELEAKLDKYETALRCIANETITANTMALAVSTAKFALKETE